MDTNTHRTATATTAAAQIKEWADLATYATRGPWGSHPSPNKHRRITDSDGATLFFTLRKEPQSVADADFIAASRTAVPKMAAALQAVLEVHDPMQLYELDPLNGTWVYEQDERVPYGKLCRGCSEDDDSDDYEPGSYIEWPCDTVTAITDALGVES